MDNRTTPVRESSRTFVIGDIHGNYKALTQCLELSKLDYEKDELIVLGDIVDGYPEAPQCIEKLCQIKNLIVIIGNHDQWCIDWLKFGKRPNIWVDQGGQATIDAYLQEAEKTDDTSLMTTHREFWKKAHYYYVDDKDRLFVHGGIPQDIMYKAICDYDVIDLMWDRDLAEAIIERRLKKNFQGNNFKEIYIGHTAKDGPPLNMRNVWLLDTGAGFSGVATIMDVDTKKYWQSRTGPKLYPGYNHR